MKLFSFVGEGCLRVLSSSCRLKCVVDIEQKNVSLPHRPEKKKELRFLRSARCGPWFCVSMRGRFCNLFPQSAERNCSFFSMITTNPFPLLQGLKALCKLQTRPFVGKTDQKSNLRIATTATTTVVHHLRRTFQGYLPNSSPVAALRA